MSISSTMLDRAEIRFREAAAELRPYVGCFWVVTAERGAVMRLVPDGSAAVSIQFDEATSPAWSLRGPLAAPAERRFQSPATLVGVRLRPGVAFLLTGIAAHTTVGRRVALGSALGFGDLTGGGLTARTPDDAIDRLERCLIGRLAHARVHDVVTCALDAIDRARGSVRVPEVAAGCGVSPRHLQRLMRIWIGLGPKALARVARFQAVLEQIEQAPARSRADLAVENGYFDQSHLTMDVGRLAGASPRRLTARGVSDLSKTLCADRS